MDRRRQRKPGIWKLCSTRDWLPGGNTCTVSRVGPSFRVGFDVLSLIAHIGQCIVSSPIQQRRIKKLREWYCAACLLCPCRSKPHCYREKYYSAIKDDPELHVKLTGSWETIVGELDTFRGFYFLSCTTLSNLVFSLHS